MAVGAIPQITFRQPKEVNKGRRNHFKGMPLTKDIPRVYHLGWNRYYQACCFPIHTLETGQLYLEKCPRILVVTPLKVPRVKGKAANCCISILIIFSEVFRNRPFVSCMDGNSCDWDDDSYTVQKFSKFWISLAWYIFSLIVKTAVNNNVYLINVFRLKKDQTLHSIAVYSLIKLCNMQLRYYRKRHKNVYNKMPIQCVLGCWSL